VDKVAQRRGGPLKLQKLWKDNCKDVYLKLQTGYVMQLDKKFW
jgi:hypothetical protein